MRRRCRGCKETLRVETESAAHRIAHAARLAMSEPRGPVHLDIPPASRDARRCRWRRRAVPIRCRIPTRAALDRAARALSGASRPLLLAGLHCRSSGRDAQWLRAFAEALPAPVLTTARAKGALPDPHPLVLGVLGVGGVEDPLLDARRSRRRDRPRHARGRRLPAACWSSAPVLALRPAAAPDGRVLGGSRARRRGAIIEELAHGSATSPVPTGTSPTLDRLRREGAARRRRRRPRRATCRAPRPRGDAGGHDRDGGRGRLSRPCVVAAWQAVDPREFLSSNGSARRDSRCPPRWRPTSSIPTRRVVCFTDAGRLAAGRAAELETAARLGVSRRGDRLRARLGRSIADAPGACEGRRECRRPPWTPRRHSWSRWDGRSPPSADPALIAV